MNPEYPIYIVSKGRWEKRHTSKVLEWMQVPYRIIIEKQEYKKYAKYINKKKILILPKKYQDEYDTCDDLGYSKSKGSGAARNFAWDHALSLKAKWHWLLDDNIQSFERLNRNFRIIVKSGAIFKAAEDFVNRYENVYISGFHYRMFAPNHEALPPFYLNTRVYSCLLIRSNIPYRWRCRYNEDTDLCLRVLKDGFCTILFNAFLANKLTTQSVKGGNTEELYKEGTLAKSQMLRDLHPDVTKVVWRFRRWHHYVDYSRFQKNKLIRKVDYNYTKKVNNYNMVLVEKKGNI